MKLTLTYPGYGRRCPGSKLDVFCCSHLQLGWMNESLKYSHILGAETKAFDTGLTFDECISKCQVNNE